jgi:hypothetical protein
MKTYVLIISEAFPVTHSKAGKPTFFYTKIRDKQKIHTIRKNYQYWKKRIDEVNAGNAVLSLRQWTGKPRKSPQNEIFQFGKGEVGIQKMTSNLLFYVVKESTDPGIISDEVLAKNDGLSVEDFSEWFENFKTPEPYAIIHFTDFRY